MTTHHNHQLSSGAAVLRTLLAVAALAACGKPRPAMQGAPPAAAVPDSTLADSAARGARATDSAAAARAAPTPVPMQASPAHALVGSWVLRTLEPGRRGPRLQLAIDSATGATFRVRVAFLMQGDVGLDPTRFEATRGQIAPDGTMHLTVQLKGRAEPEGELAGTLAGDTIRLRTFQWGDVNQAATGVHWLLVRER